MEKEYAMRGTKLTFRPLPNDVLLSIGQLLRAWAEIEQVINAYIKGLTPLNESQLILFLSRQNISAKIALAAKLAKLKGKRADQRHQRLFVIKSEAVTSFNIALKCRNVVAHGSYVGVTREGKYAFETSDGGVYDKLVFETDVHCYDADNLGRIAEYSEAIIDGLTHELKLRSLLERRLPRALKRHSKAPKLSRKKK